MTGNREHREEIEAASPLLGGAPREMPYRLPEGYFVELPGKLLELVPDATFSDSVERETARQEIERLSPLLATVSGVNPFKGGPDSGTGIPVIGMPEPVDTEMREQSSPRIRRAGWMPYAAAAAVAGVLAFFTLRPSVDGGKSLASEQGKAQSSIDATLPMTSDEEGLAAYLDEQLDPILLTVESNDSLMLGDALGILESRDSLQTALFDDIPYKELYAFIGEIPDLTGTRLDME